MQTIVKIDFFAQPATKELLILSIASSFLGVKTTYLDFWWLKNFLNFWIQMELFSTKIRRLGTFTSDYFGEHKFWYLAQSGLKLKKDQTDF